MPAETPVFMRVCSTSENSEFSRVPRDERDGQQEERAATEASAPGAFVHIPHGWSLGQYSFLRQPVRTRSSMGQAASVSAAGLLQEGHDRMGKWLAYGMGAAGVVAAAAALVGEAKPAAPQPSPQLLGLWINPSYWSGNRENASGSLAKLVISMKPGHILVHAWGNCFPEPCDWKTATGHAYATNAYGKVRATGFSVTYDFGFSQHTLVGYRRGSALVVYDFDRFAKGDTRLDHFSSQRLSR
jgi:hypothetical protein